jgi:hypothetical protein
MRFGALPLRFWSAYDSAFAAFSSALPTVLARWIASALREKNTFVQEKTSSVRSP